MSDLPAPNRPKVDQRVKLTAGFIENSSNPERQREYRGVVEHEVCMSGPDHVLVRWDGIERLHPVLKHYLEVE